jgi:hypothetical protein
MRVGRPRPSCSPPASPGGADDALRTLLTQYDSVALAEGRRFEVYYSGTLRVFDVRSRALYALPLAPDSTGARLASDPPCRRLQRDWPPPESWRTVAP